jgi:hypothetical protein
MFLTGFNDYEHDRFQNLTIRFVAGGGQGVKAVKSENIQLDFDAGIDYQRENFLNRLNRLNRNSAEANFGDNLSYQVSKGTSVTQSMRVFTNLSDTGSYRVNFDIGSSTVLKRWLGWHVTASDRFLSNPVQGRQRNDLLISTGFRLTFAKAAPQD